MKVEGDAERGPCKLLYDEKEGGGVLSGDQVQSCLKMQSEALALYDRAAALGLKDATSCAPMSRPAPAQAARGDVEDGPRDGAPGVPGFAGVALMGTQGSGAPPSIQRTSATMSACASGSSGGIGSPSTP
jgi:hypothetical protein